MKYAIQPPGKIDYTIIAETNGHKWMKYGLFTCCKVCGLIRRADDKNKPCKGPSQVTVR